MISGTFCYPCDSSKYHSMKTKMTSYSAVYMFSFCLLFLSCGTKKNMNDKNSLKNEIIQTEQQFETAAREKGIEEAFFSFADEHAVIKREHDTLILGKAGIKNYYHNPVYKEASVTWKPDFTDVSDDGTLGYTFGKYTWKAKDRNGKVAEYRGIFHTVWKRQSDGTWKYVWD
jgi:ketosteroid isomerase-like protein